MRCRLTLNLNNLKTKNMKNIMKNQKKSKRFPSWGCKGLLSVVLSGLVVNAFAQSVDVCADALPYTIASTVDASGASTYQWLENGQIISNASAPTYVVPSGKAAGQYTYIRQAKSADCSEWQSSNEFTVTVFNCTFAPPCTVTSCIATFTDPRDGKKYKTVVMPDGKTWFAQNLNYTKDLTYNAYAYEANGKQFTSTNNGVPAIGSYWCPAVDGSVTSGSEADCRTYGALYTWETVMMVDGKYADETKTSTAWDESWVSPYYYAGAPNSSPNADKNNARGGTNAKGGGRGICPLGWHVPTITEWTVLLDLVNEDGTGSSFANADCNAYKSKDAWQKLRSPMSYDLTDPGDGSWPSSAEPALGNLGFDVVPTGYRCAETQNWFRTGLYARGTSTQLMASTPSHDYAGNSVAYSKNSIVHTYCTPRAEGHPVRCVVD
jgi:uncharacterized protein (TIGR02145 family)